MNDPITALLELAHQQEVLLMTKRMMPELSDGDRILNFKFKPNLVSVTSFHPRDPSTQTAWLLLLLPGEYDSRTIHFTQSVEVIQCGHYSHLELPKQLAAR